MSVQSRFRLVVASVIAVLMCLPSAALASDEPTAELDGRRIDPALVSEYHCHDFDNPVFRCFGTESELDADMAARRGGGDFGAGYIRAYADAGLSGSSIILTSDVWNLASIGWNNRISSVQSVGFQSGTFHQHAGYGGWGFFVCCGAGYTYVGDAFNDQFSSFDR